VSPGASFWTAVVQRPSPLVADTRSDGPVASAMWRYGGNVAELITAGAGTVVLAMQAAATGSSVGALERLLAASVVPGSAELGAADGTWFCCDGAVVPRPGERVRWSVAVGATPIARPITEPPATPCGLTNLGQTCHLNAVIQVLVHAYPRLCNALLAVTGPTPPAVLELRGVLARMSLSPSTAPVWPCALVDALGLDRAVQEDAEDTFLRLERLCCPLAASDLDTPPTSPLESAWRDSFEGTLASETACRGCGNTVVRAERFSLLQLVPTSSLAASLERFSAADELTGENQYACASCTPVKRDGSRRIVVRRYPRSLCVLLKRFRVVGATREKLCVATTVPMAWRPNGDVPGAEGQYRLVAAISHIGSSCDGGHCVADALVGDEWLHFDDADVSVSDAFDGDSYVSRDCYVLVYSWLTGNAPARVRAQLPDDLLGEATANVRLLEELQSVVAAAVSPSSDAPSFCVRVFDCSAVGLEVDAAGKAVGAAAEAAFLEICRLGGAHRTRKATSMVLKGCTRDTTIAELRMRVAELVGRDPVRLRLFHGGKVVALPAASTLGVLGMPAGGDAVVVDCGQYSQVNSSIGT
jgi:hypothetical protein